MFAKLPKIDDQLAVIKEGTHSTCAVEKDAIHSWRAAVVELHLGKVLERTSMVPVGHENGIDRLVIICRRRSVDSKWSY